MLCCAVLYCSTDVFEEGWGMPGPPFHGQFGCMTKEGIRKPVWRAFQALHQAVRYCELHNNRPNFALSLLFSGVIVQIAADQSDFQ